ncbi:MAG: hypothetical protein J0M12_05655 [Deltaproteobacteria bacterium]|nr:hypothetical protein [Deltaproteobacteria bacterium]
MISSLTSIKRFRLRALAALSIAGLLVGLLTAVSPAVAQVEFKPSVESGASSQEVIDSEPTPSKKTPKGSNFTKYAQSLRLICSQLDEDGRREAMFRILLPLPDEFSDCPGCKSFLRSFASVCKASRAKTPKKKIEKKEKVEEPTEAEAAPEAPDSEDSEAVETPAAPAATPLKVEAALPRAQREPSTKLINSVSTLMIELSEDERRAADAARAMQALSIALADPAGMTPGESDYFQILSAYIIAPFARILQKEDERPTEEQDHPAAGSPPVDDLFTF